MEGFEVRQGFGGLWVQGLGSCPALSSRAKPAKLCAAAGCRTWASRLYDFIDDTLGSFRVCPTVQRLIADNGNGLYGWLSKLWSLFGSRL